MHDLERDQLFALKSADTIPPETLFIHVGGESTKASSHPTNELPLWTNAFTILSSNFSLRRLRLYQCSLNDSAVSLLCRYFPLLAWLNIRTHPFIQITIK